MFFSGRVSSAAKRWAVQGRHRGLRGGVDHVLRRADAQIPTSFELRRTLGGKGEFIVVLSGKMDGPGS